MSGDHRVVGILRNLLERREQPPGDVSAASPLYTDGLNLDSLEVAEFSAMLEQELGRDPFTDGELPKTVAEVIRYYEA
jgi:acyl carrier protein